MNYLIAVLFISTVFVCLSRNAGLNKLLSAISILPQYYLIPLVVIHHVLRGSFEHNLSVAE